MDLPHHASEERDYIAMRTLTVVRQYLAAAFLLMIGLVAYGCGDSATVTPVVELASLTVDPGTLQPAFSGGTTQYTVDVSNNISSVTVTAQPAVAGDSVAINGQATTNSVIPLGAAGTTTPVNIVVSESGTNSRTYTVLLVRAGLTGNNSLQNLTVSSGTLAPTFDENTQDYTVDVASNVGSINVTPTLDDSNATMTVNGQATNSGQPRTISLSPAGQSTLITTVVTAQNSSNKTYRITVSRGVSSNNNLRGLTVSPGTLSPAFNENRTSTSYEVNNVASSVTSVTVTPRLRDTTASMTVNGQATNSGQARTIPLGAAGSNTPIFIIVTAQNGTQKTYTAGVNRAALGGNNNLSALTVSPGSLDSTFNANDLSYTVNVASGVNSMTVTPTLQATTASMTVNGQATNSGQARTITPLNPAGQNTLITIQVTAQNTISQKTYTVNVIRAALGGDNNLSALTVSPGSLDSAFNANDLSYTVNVASGVNSMTVTPTLQATTASMTVNGQATNSGQARTITPLNPAGQNTLITIQVTAQNTISQKTYTVNVIRAALGGNDTLQSLTVSPGTLSPAFSVARTLPYTVNNIGSSVTSILVTAPPQDPSASVTINTQGGNSRSIPLPGGPSSTEIEVLVIAPNGNDRTYLITVNQPAPAAPPAAPTSAPDLIEADDSCPLNNVVGGDPTQCLSGSREDNITNVTRPRFTIPQPGPGETPNLYVDGTKVDSTFDQGSSTLKPNADLSGSGTGVQHSITSTVTNTATTLESDESDDLTVTISTGQSGV